MRIGKYVLEHNARMPFWMMEYLSERYEALERYLEEKVQTDEIEVFFDYSRQSESVYISFQTENGNYGTRISNHSVFSGTGADKRIYLSAFETWTDCKKYFLNEIVPTALEEIK